MATFEYKLRTLINATLVNREDITKIEDKDTVNDVSKFLIIFIENEQITDANELTTVHDKFNELLVNRSLALDTVYSVTDETSTYVFKYKNGTLYMVRYRFSSVGVLDVLRLRASTTSTTILSYGSKQGSMGDTAQNSILGLLRTFITGELSPITNPFEKLKVDLIPIAKMELNTASLHLKNKIGQEYLIEANSILTNSDELFEAIETSLVNSGALLSTTVPKYIVKGTIQLNSVMIQMFGYFVKDAFKLTTVT